MIAALHFSLSVDDCDQMHAQRTVPYAYRQIVGISVVETNMLNSTVEEGTG